MGRRSTAAHLSEAAQKEYIARIAAVRAVHGPKTVGTRAFSDGTYKCGLCDAVVEKVGDKWIHR